MVYFYWLIRRKCPARPSSDGPSLCLIHGTVQSPSTSNYVYKVTNVLRLGKSSIYVRFNKASCLRRFLGIFLIVSVSIQSQPNSTLSQQSWSNRPRARPQRGLVSNHAVHHDLFPADQSRRCNNIYTIGYKCIFFYGTSSGLGSSVLLIVFIR